MTLTTTASISTSPNRDLEHLRTLALFHYVVASLLALVSLLPVIHLMIGIAILSGWFPQGEGEAAPAFVVWIFVGIASAIILLGWAFAACVFFAGRSLARQRNYTFCLVIAGLSCFFMPFGTVLGVFTIVVLMRDSVKPLFAGS
jgi:hypothetical protein